MQFNEYVMADNKAQITVFIIIGIAILTAFSILFLIREQSGNLLGEGSFDEGSFQKGDIESVRGLVQDCVDQTSKDAVFLAGRQGGYTYLEDSVNGYLSCQSCFKIHGFENVSFGYLSDKGNVLVTKQQMLRQISKYVENTLPYCLDNLKVFTEKGFSFDDADISAETTLPEKAVSVLVNYPFILRKGESLSEMGYFESIIPVDLNKMYDASSFLINYVATYPGKEFSDAFFSEGFDRFSLKYAVNQLTTGNENFYILNDSVSVLYGKEYIFVFAEG